MNYLYARFKKDYPENKEELDLLYNYDNNFKFFKPGIFTKANIQKYGEKALKNALDNDQTQILKDNNINKAKFFLENMPCVSEQIYNSDILSEEDLINISKYANDTNLKSFFWGYMKPDKISKIKEIFANPIFTKNLLFLSKHFNIHNIEDKLYATIIEEKFNTFTDLIDERYLSNTILFPDFIEMYYNNKYLIDNELNQEEIVILNDYMFNKEYLSFSLSRNNMQKYYDEREYSIKCRINFTYGSTLKDMISEVYFGKRYNQLLDILKDSQKILNEDKKELEEIKKFIKLLETEDKIELKKLIEDLKYNTIIAERLKEKIKPLAKKQMIDKINTIVIIKNNQIIKLDGQDFYMLVHKIKGFSNSQIATELHRDPSTWGKHYEEDGYISTSAINQYHIGIVDGDGYIIGFKEITNEDILQMGPKDILTDVKMIKNRKDNEHVRYMEPNDLINETENVYNEIVLKRYKEKEAILPNYVVSLDNVSSKDKEVSDYFNIPIYEIESNVYADKMIQRFNYYINMHKYIEACDILKNLATGFNTSRYARNKYLNKIALQDELNYICQSFTGSTEELKYIIKTFKEISKLLSKYYESYIEINTLDLEKHTR